MSSSSMARYVQQSVADLDEQSSVEAISKISVSGGEEENDKQNDETDDKREQAGDDEFEHDAEDENEDDGESGDGHGAQGDGDHDSLDNTKTILNKTDNKNKDNTITPTTTTTSSTSASSVTSSGSPAAVISPSSNFTVNHRYSGEVKWYDVKKCFGFIFCVLPGDTEPVEIFVHQRDLQNPTVALFQKQKVEFVMDASDGGKPKAKGVSGPNGAPLPPPHKTHLEQRFQKRWLEHPEISCGHVKWFDLKKGYGYLSPEDGSGDVFAHNQDVLSDGGFRTLVQGQDVEFVIHVEPGKDGVPKRRANSITGPGGHPIMPPPKDGVLASNATPQQQHGSMAMPKHVPGVVYIQPMQQMQQMQQIQQMQMQMQMQQTGPGPVRLKAGGKHKAYRGTVKFYNVAKQFGFIVPATGGSDLHFSSMGLDPGVVALSPGQIVEYNIFAKPDGMVRAQDVGVVAEATLGGVVTGVPVAYGMNMAGMEQGMPVGMSSLDDNSVPQMQMQMGRKRTRDDTGAARVAGPAYHGRGGGSMEGGEYPPDSSAVVIGMGGNKFARSDAGGGMIMAPMQPQQQMLAHGHAHGQMPMPMRMQMQMGSGLVHGVPQFDYVQYGQQQTYNHMYYQQ